MSILNISDVEDLLDSAPTARDLHSVWQRRQPLPSPHGKSEHSDRAPRIAWLDDLSLVERFIVQAVRTREFLLAIDAAREILHGSALFSDEDRPRLVRIRIQYAAALARLGFTREARTELEGCVTSRLGRGLKADLYVQMGHVLLEEWHQAGSRTVQLEAAQQGFLFYERAAQLDSDRIEPLALAASTGLLSAAGGSNLGSYARELARVVLRIAADKRNSDGPALQIVWSDATARAVLGDIEAASRCFEELQGIEGVTTAQLAEARYQAQALAEALGRRRDLFNAAFPPLQLLVFAGHVPDRPGDPVRFPPESIPAARDAIRQALERSEARVGMTCASAGGDLLFADALLDRGAALHLVLPWARDEFRHTSVEPYDPPDGPHIWQRLYERGVGEATTVREVGYLYEPRSAVGWEYLTEVTAGIALQTARALRLDVQPIVLWDGRPGRGPGGTEAFHAFWKRRLKLSPEVLSLPIPAGESITIGGERAEVGCEHAIIHQEVKSMLFADVVGYSRLAESATREFIGSFLDSLGRLVATSRHAPCSVNTWGDAIYAVFDFAQDAGLFALELAGMVEDQKRDWFARGLGWQSRAADGTIEGHPIGIRVGLHTGPVAVHFDAVVRQLRFTGAHVTRAARIEPIAQQGQVFASEEFSAMAELGGELARLGTSPRQGSGLTAFCEYAGSRQLAKKFPGIHRIYRVRARRALMIEELAKAAHEVYCEDARNRGETAETNSSLRPWEELSDDLKDANRGQVADIPNKLRLIGWELAAMEGMRPADFVLSPEQLETLAIREHDRWMDERKQRGWTWAPIRNNALKHHSAMVDWAKLSPSDQEKDRSSIRQLPKLLDHAGFRLKRITKPGVI